MTLRKKYSKEFKWNAISLVNEQGDNNAQADITPGISPILLGRWNKKSKWEGECFENHNLSTLHLSMLYSLSFLLFSLCGF